MFNKMTEEMMKDVTITCEVRNCQASLMIDGTRNGVRAAMLSIIYRMAEHEETTAVEILEEMLQVAKEVQEESNPFHTKIRQMAEEVARDIMNEHGDELLRIFKNAMGVKDNE